MQTMSDSMSLKITKFEKGMKKKGFVASRKVKKNNPHLMFFLEYPKGCINTQINTWYSVHSNQDYISDDNISQMAEELHFEKKKDLENYVGCTYEFKTYIQLLKEKNLI